MTAFCDVKIMPISPVFTETGSYLCENAIFPLVLDINALFSTTPE